MKKVIKYLCAGSLATGVNLGLLFVCVEYFHLWYLSAAVLSFTFGAITSFLLQKFWVFENDSLEKAHTQLFGFMFFAMLMLVVNTFLLYLFVEKLHVWYLLSQALTSLIIAFLNYTCFNLVIFKK
jgi:putative flippase GtrA